MIENCCNGVKILDLAEDYNVTGSEYVVIAEKDLNYKLPVSQLADIVIQRIFGNDSTTGMLSAAIEKVFQSDTPLADVRLDNNKILFKFGIPEGKQGMAGKDGRDGVNGRDGVDGKDGKDGKDAVTYRLVVAYLSNNDRVNPPAKPVGGNWDPITNIITYPEGWEANDTNATNDYTWMSTATFSSEREITIDWSDPVCLTGENGRDGTDALSIEFIYKLTTTHEEVPPTPLSTTLAEAISHGWTDHPEGVTEALQCEWVSSHTFQSDGTWSTWNEPTIWSKWGTVGKDGDGVEYVYKRTLIAETPEAITNNELNDEFLPEGWEDNPQGVNSQYPYEWVCMRKYNGTTKLWGSFSAPALWAKYGVNGALGRNLEIRYQATKDSNTKPTLDVLLRTNRIPSNWSLTMPEYDNNNEAIWAIHGLVDNTDELYLDLNITEDKRGWQGPYLLSALAGEPAGTIKLWGSTTPPTGWAICDGKAYEKAKYPKLFAAIGYTFNTDNQGETFNIPDLAGKFVLQYDTSNSGLEKNIGKEGGAANGLVTLTINEMPKHDHQYDEWQTGNLNIGRFSIKSNVDSNVRKTMKTTSTGEGKPFSILPPYLTLVYIIKLG